MCNQWGLPEKKGTGASLEKRLAVGKRGKTSGQSHEKETCRQCYEARENVTGDKRSCVKST